MDPLLFAARGIVPIAYAVFAFALGVTAGMLVRRTVPAMTITLAVFVAVQIAVPQLVRPHLIPPTRSTVAITPSNFDQLLIGPDRRVKVGAKPADPGARLQSSPTVDASGHAIDSIPPTPTLSPASGPCAPRAQPAQHPAGADAEFAGCLAEIKRLGYRQRVTYQPSSRFWAFQAYETAIFVGLALLLSGFCFWRLRQRPV